MDNDSAVSKFKKILTEQPDLSPGAAALTLLLDFMNQDNSETIQGLEKNIKSLVVALIEVGLSVTSVKSACELFMRFITLASLDHSDFRECKQVLSQRGTLFLNRVSTARPKISKLGQKFIVNGAKILVHSYSRVVYQTLVEAFSAGKMFHVFVTESGPDYSGRLMHEKLEKAGISCTLVLDCAAAYILERVDCVFLGAEGVVESGGIINKVGSFTIAMCAEDLHKPLYVLAESFKFVRLFILNNKDLANELKLLCPRLNSLEQARVDFTPPSFVTLLISDLGILTTSAVSDELIKLYM